MRTFSFTEHASGSSDAISVQLADFDGKWLNNWFPEKTDRITASIKTSHWRYENDSGSLACGDFMVDDVSFGGPPDVLNLEAISMPVNESFNCRRHTKTWEKVTVEKIASQIADNAGIGLYYEADSVPIELLEQSEETDSELLYGVCRKYGLAMKLFCSKIIIFDEETYESKVSVAALNKGDVIKWNANTSLTGIYDTATVKYSDPSTGQDCTYKHIFRDGSRNLEINEKSDDKADAQRKAKAALRDANRNEKTMSISIFPDVRITAGCCVDIAGFGKFDGKYFVDKVYHSIGSGYSMKLDVHRVLAGLTEK